MTERFSRANITASSSPPESFMVKYQCPEVREEKFEVSPTTHTHANRSSSIPRTWVLRAETE